jgi:hypothetical protein
MSVLTPKRLFLCVVAVLLATSAFASHPSPRAYARMAYDAKNDVVVLFGGRGMPDQATSLLHSSNETWHFGGATWAQRFPETVPPARSVHGMVAGEEGRIYMFGGRQEPIDVDSDPAFLSDLWMWENDNWTRLDEGSATRPSPRQYAGLAFDTDRDILVLFGGQVYGGEEGDEVVYDFETWEFSPATGQWTEILPDAPPVGKAQLVYDGISKKVVMIGVTDDDLATPLMYTYDGATHEWTKESPAKLPTCTNEGSLFQQSNGRLIYFGGLCRTGTPASEEVFEFADNTWTKLTLIAGAARGIAQATTWDPEKDRAVVYGGTQIGSTILVSFTNRYENLRWSRVPESQTRPQGRSLMAFDKDPRGDRVLMYGGLSEFGAVIYLADSWSLQNGRWLPGTNPGTPPPTGGCDNPLTSYDTDRNKLVLVCLGSEVWEFDGTNWKEFTELDPIPNERRFAAMVYDQKLKKTVLFGGFFNSSYRNDTWTWDGAKWIELEDIDNDDRPPHRGTMAMWYDPLAQKTILYGGIGRGSLNEKVKRFSDMWSFDGSRWVNMQVAATPGVRFRPLQAVNPATGKVTIFGGLRSEPVDEDSIRQFFADDLWEWDGSASRWTQIEQPARRPSPRQNGGLGYDPVTGKLTLFGGYGDGFYYSDTWSWDGTVWTPLLEAITGKRRSVR